MQITNSLIALIVLTSSVAFAEAPAAKGRAPLQPQPVEVPQKRPDAPNLQDFINAAITNSQQLAASHAQEKVAEVQIAIAQTGYLPNIEAEAIDSKGFPGSTGALGITGLMGSPYRSGYGYGVTATETLWDFGRTSNLTDVARAEVAAQKGRTQLTKLDVMQGALDAYMQCSLARNERETWADIAKLSAVVTREIDNYVRTGQRSIVERLLAKTQNDEAVRSLAILDKRISIMRQRMAVISGWTPEQSDCKPVEDVQSPGAEFNDRYNPYLIQSELNFNIAQAQAKEARAGYFPKLVGLATIGDVQNARFVPEQNYALGIGLTFPLFDSNVTRTELRKARAALDQRQYEMLAAKQSVSEANLKFDEEIEAARVELSHLVEELKDSELAVKQARQRYEAMKGTLVDLREAIRNLESERILYGSSQARLLRAEHLKSIYNGL